MHLLRPRSAAPVLAALALAVTALAITALGACDNETAPPFGVDAVDGADGSTAAGDVVVRSRADLARLEGIRHIGGDLVVSATSAIALPELVTIGGSLRLVGTQAEEVTPDLALVALERVGGDLEVAWTKDSGRLRLPALAEVGGHVLLTHGTWDVDLGALVAIGGDLRLNDASLVRVDLGALATIGGSVRLLRFGVAQGTALGLDLPELTSVEGDLELAQGADLELAAPKLATIGRDLDVAGLRVSLDLAGLATLGDDLVLDNVDVDLLDLGALATVSGSLQWNNARGAGLTTVELDALATVVGDIRLTGVANLQTFALPALTDLGGALALDGAPSLSRLDVRVLARTFGDLVVREAGNVLVLADRLATIGGDLRLEDNGRMQGDLPLLASVVGSLVMSGGTLVDPGVPALETVGRDLVLEDLSVEQDTIALTSLASVGGTLRVARTLFLDRLDAPGLASVGSIQGGFPTGDLTLVENYALATLDLGALARVERDLAIRANPRLPAATVEALRGAVSVGGTTTTCGNDGDAACPAE